MSKATSNFVSALLAAGLFAAVPAQAEQELIAQLVLMTVRLQLQLV